VELQKKIRGILLAADTRRVRMVETVTFSSDPGGMYGRLQVLDLVSPCVRNLIIQRTDHPVNWDIENHCEDSCRNSLDMQLVNSGLFFPSLTNIWIGSFSLLVAGILHLVCISAPDLLSLAVCKQAYQGRWLYGLFSPRRARTVGAIHKLFYLSSSWRR
jgi:hypothetical protein